MIHHQRDHKLRMSRLVEGTILVRNGEITVNCGVGVLVILFGGQYI
jgi:hypothetical protein